MKNKPVNIFQSAQDCWPEDEASIQADCHNRRVGFGEYSAQELADYMAKDCAHMYKVFSGESDGPELIRRFNAELVRLGCTPPAPFAS